MRCCATKSAWGGGILLAALVTAGIQIADSWHDRVVARDAATDINAALEADGRFPGVRSVVVAKRTVVLYGVIDDETTWPGAQDPAQALDALADATAPKARIENLVGLTSHALLPAVSTSGE